MFEIDFYTFSLLEGVFWIALSFVVVFYFLKEMPDKYSFLGAYTGATLFIFGITGFLETYIGEFMLYPAEWIFIMKVITVLLQVAAIYWYIHLQLKGKTKATAS